MISYSWWYAILCLFTGYAVLYTLYTHCSSVYFKPNSLESWWARLIQSPDATLTDEYLWVKTFLSVVLTATTILTGCWMFCCKDTYFHKRRSSKTKCSTRSIAKICMVTVTTVCIVAYISNGLSNALIVIITSASLAAISQVDIFSDRNSFYSLLWKIVSWMMIVSVPWEFLRLYQHEVAKQISQTMNGLPSECLPKEATAWTTFRLWLNEMVSWRQDESICLKYHKAILVDPIWEVTPAKVVSSLLATVITHPMERLASSVGSSYNLLFQHIPVQWQPLIMIQLLVLFIFLILIFNSYHISFPMLFRLEPKSPIPMIKDNAQDQ